MLSARQSLSRELFGHKCFENTIFITLDKPPSDPTRSELIQLWFDCIKSKYLHNIPTFPDNELHVPLDLLIPSHNISFDRINALITE